MLSRKYYVAAAIAVMMGTTPVVAHHSFSAEFDITKTIKVSGKVSSVRWSNPHAWIYVDVTGADGKVVNWAFEMNAANALYRRGWRREDVPAGLEVTIEGWLARNGTPTANTSTITLPDGRRLFAGSGPGEGAAPR
jgi:hypothetical protein